MVPIGPIGWGRGWGVPNPGINPRTKKMFWGVQNKTKGGHLFSEKLPIFEYLVLTSLRSDIPRSNVLIQDKNLILKINFKNTWPCLSGRVVGRRL